MLFQVKCKSYNKDKQRYPAANFNNTQKIMDDFYKQILIKPRRNQSDNGKLRNSKSSHNAINPIDAINATNGINLM